MEANLSNISLLENHEQQYAIISADITSKIGKLSSQTGNDRKQLCGEVEKLIEDGQELMEQMELEVRDVNPALRSKYANRISSYKAEMSRLNQDFSRVRYRNNVHFAGNSDGFYAEFGDLNTEQKQRLLDTTEQIEEAGKHLANGYKIAIETEELGTRVLQDLHAQRETLKSSLNRIHETNADVGMSSQILNGMVKRSVQHRLVLAGISAIFVLVLVVTVYNKF